MNNTKEWCALDTVEVMSVRGKPLSYTFFVVVSFPFFIPVVPSSPHPPFPFQTACPYFLDFFLTCSWALCLKGERSRREIVSPTVKKVHPFHFIFPFSSSFFLPHSPSNLPNLDYSVFFPLAETCNKKKLLLKHSLRSSQQINEHSSLSLSLQSS
ncbi:MAG: hypothetical protein JOS17DRAFT_127622 [Linnemannia elongata]|nr:MAG: hypothetical protein JOS17DRAFT_127622 [Linnemannia elongata]